MAFRHGRRKRLPPKVRGAVCVVQFPSGPMQPLVSAPCILGVVQVHIASGCITLSDCNFLVLPLDQFLGGGVTKWVSARANLVIITPKL